LNTERIRITAEQAVLALKAIGLSSSAKVIAERMGTDSRAVATAMRGAVADGRVSIAYGKSVARYRFKRLTPKPAEGGVNG